MSNQTDQPYLAIATPVFDSFDKSIRSHVGDIAGFFTLETFLVNLLPEGVRGVNIVVSNTCGQTFTFVLDGPQVSALLEDCSAAELPDLFSYLSSGCVFRPCMSEKEISQTPITTTVFEKLCSIRFMRTLVFTRRCLIRASTLLISTPQMTLRRSSRMICH